MPKLKPTDIEPTSDEDAAIRAGIARCRHLGAYRRRFCPDEACVRADPSNRGARRSPARSANSTPQGANYHSPRCRHRRPLPGERSGLADATERRPEASHCPRVESTDEVNSCPAIAPRLRPRWSSPSPAPAPDRGPRGCRRDSRFRPTGGSCPVSPRP